MNTTNITPPDATVSDRIDEEDIRLTTGFADIFTAILLGFGISLLVGIGFWIGGLVVIGVAFALAKPLVETRRFAACANVLAVGIAIGAGVLFSFAETALLVPVALLCGAFWYFYRVPLALALAIASLASLVVLLVTSAVQMSWLLDPAEALTDGKFAALLLGLLLFAAAMWYDAKDRLRQTRMSAVAFWLHLGAAPLFVHGLFSAFGIDPWRGDTASPALVFPLFAVLTLISLVIDRRPLLASSFVYMVGATGNLLYGTGGKEDQVAPALNAAMAPAVIGILLLFLAAGWSPLRGWLLSVLPDALTRHLAPAAKRAVPLPVEDRAPDLPEAESEPVRLVLGFNDLFVALGAASLFVGAIVVGAMVTIQMTPDWKEQEAARQFFQSIAVWPPILIPAAAMWAVAEYFVRIRRMAWPAITSALGFALMAGLGSILLAFQFALARYPAMLVGRGQTEDALPFGVAISCVILASFAGLAANMAFWWRHRLPISFALGIAALWPLAGGGFDRCRAG